MGGAAPASLTRGAPAISLWHFALHDASVPRVGPRSPHRLAFALHPERRVWAAGSWGCGDWSSRAQSHVSGLSPGPPRRPCVHTCVPGLEAGGGWAAWSQEEHRTCSEVWAFPASLPAPEMLPRAATHSPERGCRPCPGGVGTGLPAAGPLDDSSRVVGGQPRVLTLWAPPLAPPGRASCSTSRALGTGLQRPQDGPPVQALSCSPSGWPWNVLAAEEGTAATASRPLCALALFPISRYQRVRMFPA